MATSTTLFPDASSAIVSRVPGLRACWGLGWSGAHDGWTAALVSGGGVVQRAVCERSPRSVVVGASFDRPGHGRLSADKAEVDLLTATGTLCGMWCAGRPGLGLRDAGNASGGTSVECCMRRDSHDTADPSLVSQSRRRPRCRRSSVGSISIRHRSDTFVPDRFLIDVDPAAIRVLSSAVGEKHRWQCGQLTLFFDLISFFLPRIFFFNLIFIGVVVFFSTVFIDKSIGETSFKDACTGEISTELQFFDDVFRNRDDFPVCAVLLNELEFSDGESVWVAFFNVFFNDKSIGASSFVDISAGDSSFSVSFIGAFSGSGWSNGASINFGSFKSVLSGDTLDGVDIFTRFFRGDFLADLFCNDESKGSSAASGCWSISLVWDWVPSS